MDWDTPPRIDEEEMIDDQNQPYADFRSSMTDVQRANRFLGGTAAVTATVSRWLRERKASTDRLDRPLTILDVATGSGDLPMEILRVARKERMPARVIGLDFSVPILRFAAEVTGAEPHLRLVRGTAFRLPFRDSSIDYVICSLAFHHFGFERSVAALREMERVARYGWQVNDLRRAWSAWYLFRALSTAARMNRLTRHDGPASILRAYSLPEYRAMPSALGLSEGTDYRLVRSPFYRVALVRDKPAPITGKKD